MAGCAQQPGGSAAYPLEAEPVLGSPAESPLLNYAGSLARTRPHKNAVALLETGHEALLARIHLIRSARKSIAIQTLIWANDEAGRLFMYELIQAARRGVNVQFLIDHLSSEQHLAFATYLADAHPCFQVKLFNPVSNLLNQPKAQSLFLEKLYALIFKFNQFNHRMHNKTFVVDEQVMITGGRNYQNAYYDLAPGMNYKDRDVLAIGPVVDQVVASFQDYWDSPYAVSLAELSDVRQAVVNGTLTPPGTRDEFLLNGLYEEVNAALAAPDVVREHFVDPLQQVEEAYYVSDSPRKRDRLLVWFGASSELTRHLAGIVTRAQESVTIQTPYLVLTNRAVALFKSLREEHPDLEVRISTNSLAATDSWHVYALSYKQKQVYLQTLNFRIFEFKPKPQDLAAFMPQRERLADAVTLCLHGKSLVVDDAIAFVGSYNLDPRSENINTESGLFIRDPTFARTLRGLIERDMAPGNAWVIARKRHLLGLSYPNAALVRLSHWVPLVDLWPFRYATAFELKPGKPNVPPEHPDFYDNFIDVGSFPQIGEGDVGKVIGARGTKAFLGFVKPLL